ncbi:uncharacterized protein LOC100679380 [Nasonia vitripennis]|uniref:Uncharacterized protein n=1 Tax=Nasonia vitripennis TaxID=7425 RepID=A0A7M7GFF6_NASVI|nr:uncharacterized protein LOC100679380 [Nasonia vitripennis]
MEDLVDDRDVLLLARAKDLEHEYENLVRSLDAAYDAVRQINAAMSENRSEAKRVFQERLELLASRPSTNANNNRQNYDRINSVTRNAVTKDSIVIRSGNDAVSRKPQTVLVTGGHEKLARYVIALAAKKNKGTTKSTASVVAAQNNSSRAASDAVVPSLIYYSQQKTATPQRVGIKGYVGDEHSYAEVDTKTGLLGHSVTQEEENKSAKRNETAEIEVDLSIVKSELDDESNDCEARLDSTVDDPSSSRDHSASDSATSTPSAITLTTMPKLKVIQQEAYEYKIRGRRKKKVEDPMDEEALTRKRVMTRNRMRRWRAKKRLEQMTDIITKNNYS